MGLLSTETIRKKAAAEPRYALARAAHLAVSHATRRLAPRRHAPPVILTLFLTYRCNLNCHMCGQNKLFSGFERKELSVDDYAELLGEFRTLKPSICLFGGEPLLYPDFEELVARIRALGFRQHLITNGTLLSRFPPEALLELDRITVSINGDREIHDRIVGRKGAFDALAAGVDAVLLARKRRRTRKPLVYALVTVTQENHRTLAHLAHKLNLMGLDGVTFQHLSYITERELEKQRRMLEGTPYESALEFVEGYLGSPKIDARALHRELNAARAITTMDVFVFPDFSLKDTAAYYSDGAFKRFGKKRCRFGWFEATVMPDGTLTTCMNLPLGRTDGGFLSSWRSDEWMRYREFFAGRTLPYCVRCCGLYRY